jgi:hypothetical protein
MPALESFLFLALLCLGSDGREAKPEDHLSNQIRRIRTIVDELQRRLGDTTRVLVSVDRGNDRLVSVHPSETDQGTYLLSLDRDFLLLLDERDLRAVVAHELGHVWIYTHHPYLQTENQANQTALKVVSREDLERAYRKVGLHKGEEVDIQAFVGR